MKRILILFGALAGVALLTVSGNLISEHVRVIADVREVSVPLVAELPLLERRASLLKEQVELAQLQSAMRVGSQEERVHVYVLPKEFDMDRIVALFDVFSLTIPQQAYIGSMSPVVFGEPATVGHALQALPITVSFSVHENGMHTLLDLFRLAGTVTLSDAFSKDELETLLAGIETESPAGIIPLEQFLSADLLEYAREPRPYEEQLRRSFTSAHVQHMFDDLLRTSLLRDARSYLGGPAGLLLKEQKLWPMPFMAFEEIRSVPGRAQGWHTVTLVLHTYRRVSEGETL